jgi:hypothetical protein
MAKAKFRFDFEELESYQKALRLTREVFRRSLSSGAFFSLLWVINCGGPRCLS